MGGKRLIQVQPDKWICERCGHEFGLQQMPFTIVKNPGAENECPFCWVEEQKVDEEGVKKAEEVKNKSLNIQQSIYTQVSNMRKQKQQQQKSAIEKSAPAMSGGKWKRTIIKRFRDAKKGENMAKYVKGKEVLIKQKIGDNQNECALVDATGKVLCKGTQANINDYLGIGEKKKPKQKKKGAGLTAPSKTTGGLCGKCAVKGCTTTFRNLGTVKYKNGNVKECSSFKEAV